METFQYLDDFFTTAFYLYRIANSVYEEVPLTFPGNSMLTKPGVGPRLKLHESNLVTSNINITREYVGGESVYGSKHQESVSAEYVPIVPEWQR